MNPTHPRKARGIQFRKGQFLKYRTPEVDPRVPGDIVLQVQFWARLTGLHAISISVFISYCSN